MNSSGNAQSNQKPLLKALKKHAHPLRKSSALSKNATQALPTLGIAKKLTLRPALTKKTVLVKKLVLFLRLNRAV
jgi:hypothetical protein